MSKQHIEPKCHYEGACFARSNEKCKLLTDIWFPDGKCHFQKPEQEVTNGIRHPRRYENGFNCARYRL